VLFDHIFYEKNVLFWLFITFILSGLREASRKRNMRLQLTPIFQQITAKMALFRLIALSLNLGYNLTMAKTTILQPFPNVNFSSLSLSLI